MRESSLPTTCNAENYKNLMEEQTGQIHYGGASHSCVMNGEEMDPQFWYQVYHRHDEIYALP